MALFCAHANAEQKEARKAEKFEMEETGETRLDPCLCLHTKSGSKSDESFAERNFPRPQPDLPVDYEIDSNGSLFL